MGNLLQTIQVPKDTKYVNMGFDIGKEQYILEINFITNAHNWGITVVDPNGDTTTVLASNETEQLDVSVSVYDDVTCENANIAITIFKNQDKNMYEIYLNN